MRPLTREEIVPLEAYGALRAAYRGAVIDHKRRRRMPVGPHVTLVFEDRETLRFQVQEMLWVERISDPQGVQNEIDVYNELVPLPGELSATLFIEITEAPSIRAELDRLIGIDEHVALVLGEGADAEEIPARFDPKQLDEDRISAVQYIRFRLDEGQAARFADPAAPAAVRIAHPAYRHEAAIPGEVRESLIAGLRDDPPALLPEPSARPESSAAPRTPVLFESGRVRACVPERPLHPGHVVVEPCDPDADARDGELAGELLAAVRRVADLAIERFGGCRVQADLAPGEPVRWHVLPRSDTPRSD